MPFVLAILLAGMLPPLDFDVREYHLQAPKEFFQQGRVTFLPHNVYANMALGTEMLSLLAMIVSAIGGWARWPARPSCRFHSLDRTGTIGGRPAALLAHRRRRRCAGLRVGALGRQHRRGGLVDGASACYLFLAVYALLFRDKLGTASFALAGYLAGAAVATKYPAALFVLLPLADLGDLALV